MTNDLISREAALKELREWWRSLDSLSENVLMAAIDCVCERIEEYPAVDAEPVVHSYWEPYGRNSNGTVGRWRCMNCKRTSLESGNYCIHCGAKMDKEEEKHVSD